MAPRVKLTLVNSPQVFGFVFLSFTTAVMMTHIYYDFAQASTYLWYCGAVALFQTSVYATNRQSVVVDVKLKNEFEHDNNMKEVMEVNMGNVQLLHFFHACIYLWGASCLSEYPAIQRQLSYICFTFGIYSFYCLAQSFFFGSACKALTYENSYVSLVIEGTVLAAGIWWYIHL